MASGCLAGLQDGSLVCRWLGSEEGSDCLDGSSALRFGLRFFDRVLQEFLSAFRSSMLAKAIDACLVDLANKPVYYFSVFVLFFTLTNLLASWVSKPAVDFWVWLKVAVILSSAFGLFVKTGWTALRENSFVLKALSP